jgi:hypothetical protein
LFVCCAKADAPVIPSHAMKVRAIKDDFALEMNGIVTPFHVASFVAAELTILKTHA